jgi:hypothetical protein
LTMKTSTRIFMMRKDNTLPLEDFGMTDSQR